MENTKLLVVQIKDCKDKIAIERDKLIAIFISAGSPSSKNELSDIFKNTTDGIDALETAIDILSKHL